MGSRGAGGGGERGGVSVGMSVAVLACWRPISQMIFATIKKCVGVKWRFHIQQGKRGVVHLGSGAAPLDGEGTLPLLLALQPLTPVSLSLFLPLLFRCPFHTLLCPSLPPQSVSRAPLSSPSPLSFPLGLSDFSRAISSPPLPGLSAASPIAVVSRSMYGPPWLSEPESQGRGPFG